MNEQITASLLDANRTVLNSKHWTDESIFSAIRNQVNNLAVAPKAGIFDVVAPKVKHGVFNLNPFESRETLNR